MECLIPDRLGNNPLPNGGRQKISGWILRVKNEWTWLHKSHIIAMGQVAVEDLTRWWQSLLLFDGCSAPNELNTHSTQIKFSRDLFELKMEINNQSHDRYSAHTKNGVRRTLNTTHLQSFAWRFALTHMMQLLQHIRCGGGGLSFRNSITLFSSYQSSRKLCEGKIRTNEYY